MADQQRAIETARPATPAIATDLDPGEFGLALVVAATWFFAGPWGLIPTVVFVYKIVGARLPSFPGAQVLATRLGLAQLREDWPALRDLPVAEQLRYLAGKSVELPDVVGDDNGDGAAEGDTQPLKALPTAPVAKTAAPTRPRWLQVVNDDPDRHPHALILGPTGAGKTTLATAIMGDRGGRVVVVSPKISAGAWRGAEVITLDDDASYAPLTRAMGELEQEKRERVVTLRQQGRAALEPLTVVFDEIQDLTTHVPEVGEWMVNLSSLGRELNLRLIGIGTTDEALNIRGWKASRRNYARVEMTTDRRATLNDGVRNLNIETKEIDRQARAAHLRPWRGEPAPADPAAIVRRAPLPPLPPNGHEPCPWCRSFYDCACEEGGPAVSVTARPAPTLTLAELAKLAPSLAAKRGYAPSPADQSALADLLDISEPTAQSVTVARDTAGGDVHVHVSQVATGRSPIARRRGVDVKDRRRRLAYIEAAKRGEKFEATYRRFGGSRNAMHALFTAHKAY